MNDRERQTGWTYRRRARRASVVERQCGEREREMKKEGRSVTDRLEGTDEKSVISFASDLAINPSDSTSRSLDT